MLRYVLRLGASNITQLSSKAQVFHVDSPQYELGTMNK